MSIFGSIGKFIKNAAKTAGRPLHSAVHAISKATGEVAHLAGKVPLVGPALHSTLDFTIAAPFHVGDAVLSGRRIDKAALDHLKKQIGNVKEAAPYAQTVISVVPGVGSGISGVIGGGLALAEGRSITDAIEEGVTSAIPGGPIAKSIAKAGVGIMKGKPIDEIGLAAIPIPEQTKKIVGRGLIIAKQVASGKAPDKIIVEQALKEIPGGPQAVIEFAKKNKIDLPTAVAERSLKVLTPEQQKALKIGMSVGHARNLQVRMKRNAPDNLNQLASLGKKLTAQNKILSIVSKTIKDPFGFYVGAGVMNHSHVTPVYINSLRKSLSKGDRRKGFDLALSTHIGMVTSPAVKKNVPAQVMAGYYATKGLVGASRTQKTGILKTITKTPHIRAGATIAIKQMKEEGFWKKVLKYLGISG